MAALLYFIPKVELSFALCLAFPAVMLIDWGAQQYFGRMSTNPRRLATGLLAGLGLGMLYCYALSVAWSAVF